MAIYVLMQEFTSQDNYTIEAFCDVCSKEEVVVNWAKSYDHINNVRCVKHDDVGVLLGVVNLKETARLGKLVLME